MESAKLEHMAQEKGKAKTDFQRERRKKLERPKPWDPGAIHGERLRGW